MTVRNVKEIKKRKKRKTLEVKDEESVSGSNPLLSSDNDVLDSAKKAGLYSEATEEQPESVDIAREIDKNEKLRHQNKGKIIKNR